MRRESTSLLAVALGMCLGACGGGGSSPGSSGISTSGGTTGSGSKGSGSSTGGSTTGAECHASGATCVVTTEICHLGKEVCLDGGVVCEDMGADPAQQGKFCGIGMVCNAGVCNTCANKQSCTLANPCDKGMTDCSSGVAVCADEGPDPAKEGTVCGSDAVCTLGTCALTQPPADALPLIPNDGNAPVVSAIKLQLVTYDSDSANASVLEPYITWIATGGWLALVGTEYGVGNGTALTPVHLSDTPPSDPNTLGTYLAGKVADGTLAPADGTTEYIVVLPNGSAAQQQICQSAGGYHSAFFAGNLEPMYSAIPDCRGNDPEGLEYVISHEVIESATDPYGGTWQIIDPSNPWSGIGGEVGDLCELGGGGYVDPVTGYIATGVYSNVAAEDGGAPCVPWPANINYLNVIATPVTKMAAAGSTADFTLTGWSVAVQGPWQLTVNDSSADFQTNPVLSSSTVGDGTSTTLTLTIPAGAAPGSHGAVAVTSQDPMTGAPSGVILVGVTVE